MKRCIYEDIESGKLFYMEYDESRPRAAVFEITPAQYRAMSEARRQDLTGEARGALYDRIIYGEAGRKEKASA